MTPSGANSSPGISSRKLSDRLRPRPAADKHTRSIDVVSKAPSTRSFEPASSIIVAVAASIAFHGRIVACKAGAFDLE